jgi:hypothetical protein
MVVVSVRIAHAEKLTRFRRPFKAGEGLAVEASLAVVSGIKTCESSLREQSKAGN